MINEKLKKSIATVLIPSILLPSCTTYDEYFINDDVSSINNKLPIKPLDESIAVPLIINTNDYKLLYFINEIAKDIIKTPLIAKEFAKNPREFASAYGLNDLNINLDDQLWQLVLALGDEDIHNAIITNDIAGYISLCSEKGLISKIQKNELARYQANIIAPDDPQTKSGIVAAGIAAFAVVMIITGVGCGVGTAAGAVNVEQYGNTRTYTWGNEVTGAIESRDPQVYQIWTLKKGSENTHIMLSEYNQRIVDDCIDMLNKEFPNDMKDVDLQELRQIISLNMPIK